MNWHSNTIPNYVVCLENCKNQFTKNRLYEVLLDSTTPYHIRVKKDDRGVINGWSSIYFKPLYLNSPQEVEIAKLLYG